MSKGKGLSEQELRKIALKKHRKMLAEKEYYKRSAKTDLMSFIKATKIDYQNVWFHERICSTFDSFMKSDKKILILTAPPQRGKFLPADTP